MLLRAATPQGGPSPQLAVSRTYFAIRAGLFAVAVALPFALLVGGHVADSGAQPGSISGYYHTAMRNLLVGALITIGTALFLYRGFSRLEDWLMNVAGLGAIGVAFLPAGRDAGATDGPSAFTFPHGHAACALVTFGCIALTALFCSEDTLKLQPENLRPRYRIVYRVLGIAMILLPLSAAVFTHGGQAWLFWTESAAVWTFAAYWLVKTLELGLEEAGGAAPV